MIVVQINETCGTGSIGRSAEELAVHLEQTGNTAYVFYASGHPTFSKAERIGGAWAQKLHALLSRVTGLQGYFSVRPTLRLVKRLREIGPDIVHLQNLHANYINLRILLRYLAKHDVATVITLHDCWFYTGKCTYYVAAGCQKWQQECGHCPLLHKDNINPTFFFDRTKKCLRDKKTWLDAIPRLAVIGVSEWVANEAKHSILGVREPVCIYNWIDAELFHPCDTSALRKKLQLQGKFVVLMVTANISANKGYGVLCELARVSNENWQLIIVGKNSAKLQIPNNVIHIAHTNDAHELAEYYSMADVCVNTTRFETFGKVTAEALCCGTPVIVYNNTASPELVEDGCGYVVEEESGINGIVIAIQAIQNKGKQAFTQKCVSSAQGRFDKKKGIEKYMQLYKSLQGR